MKQNRKGMGLVMAIMIVTMLLIMAAGFLTFTVNTNKSVTNQIEKVRLYWAAESGSNYSVNWWKDQSEGVRINWPYYYDPDEGDESKQFGTGNDGDNSDVEGGDYRTGNGGGGPPPPPDDPNPTPTPDDWDYDFDSGTDAESEGGMDNWPYKKLLSRN